MTVASSTSLRPAESIYFSTTLPPVLAVLNLADTHLYLRRLGLSPSLASQPPSLELLSTLLLAHHTHIPYDSSALHVPPGDWTGPSKPIQFRRGRGMELGKGNFDRIMKGKDVQPDGRKGGMPGQGSYCYGLNQLSASLLRGFGFRVSEIGARVFLHRGKDPKESGVWCVCLALATKLSMAQSYPDRWSQTTHMALLVDWPGSEERWFLDVGASSGPFFVRPPCFPCALPALVGARIKGTRQDLTHARARPVAGFGGGGSPVPIPFRDGATAPSLSPYESFLLRFEKLPIGDLPTIPDPPAGFTLYRRVTDTPIRAPELADSGPGYWTPCIHCTVATVAPEDIVMGDYFNSTHPTAPWANIFIVSVLLAPSGARKTLVHGIPAIDQEAPLHPEGKKLAKLYTKEAILGREYDVEWVVFETGPIREVLEREFNFAV
ncbi:SPOSA6832_01509, partial [Sporobolomyces salmonicolor]